MFKHKLILQLSETHQRDTNPVVEPGMGLRVWVANLNHIVAEYKVWAQPIVDAIGDGRRVPISSPKAVLQRPFGSSPLINLQYYTGPESVHRMFRQSRERFDLAKTSKYLIGRHRDLVGNHEPWSLDRARRWLLPRYRTGKQVVSALAMNNGVANETPTSSMRVSELPYCRWQLDACLL